VEKKEKKEIQQRRFSCHGAGVKGFDVAADFVGVIELSFSSATQRIVQGIILSLLNFRTL
jgi:hypothetical protein